MVCAVVFSDVINLFDRLVDILLIFLAGFNYILFLWKYSKWL